MDNTNNGAFGDTQNTVNTTLPNDSNNFLPSTPPVQDMIEELSGMPSVAQSNAPVEEFPQQQSTEMSSPTNDIIQPAISSMGTPQVTPTMDSSVNMVDDLSGMPAVEQSNAPVEEFPQQQVPQMDTPMTQTPTVPLDGVVSQTPSFGSIPVMGESVPSGMDLPVEPTVQPTESISPMADMSAPLSEPIAQSTQPVDVTVMPSIEPAAEVAPMSDTPMPQFESLNTSVDTLPSMSAEPVVAPVSPMDSTPPQDLSQPLPSFAPSMDTPMPAFNESEIVNTLGEEKKEGKGGTVVVIILITVIVALLATIGYFIYKIFLA